jgi:DNA-binding IclR family transcriptional regulator
MIAENTTYASPASLSANATPATQASDSALSGERPRTPPSAPRSGPMSVHRTLAIINLLANNATGLSLAEISRKLRSPKASVLGLLKELAALRYIRKNESGLFELAASSYRLAVDISASGSLHKVIANTLIELSKELRMSAAFGYLDRERRSLVYGDRCEANSPVRYVVKLGERLDIHSRSIGKLLLAQEPEREWPLWLGPEPYYQHTRHTRTRLAQIAADVKVIRRKKLAWTVSEQYEGIAGCACGVLDKDGRMVAGIAVQGLVDRVTEHKVKVAALLKEACETISDELRLRSIDARSLSMFI